MALRVDIARVIDSVDEEPVMKMFAVLGAGPALGIQDMTRRCCPGLTLSFQRIEGIDRPLGRNGQVPTQIHLDLFVASLEDMELLHQHGATTAPIQPHLDNGLMVMLDPAGHQFWIATRL